MAGHTDSITGLRLSPDGSYVVSNCMDNTGKIGFRVDLSIIPWYPPSGCWESGMNSLTVIKEYNVNN